MNALLIDGDGQKAKSKDATGKITRFEQTERYVWTTGNATAAYATLQPANRVETVTRDIVFIDSRYFVIRDHVKLATPGKITWLLHTERPLCSGIHNRRRLSPETVRRSHGKTGAFYVELHHNRRISGAR